MERDGRKSKVPADPIDKAERGPCLYAQHHLGRGVSDADARLRALAEMEVRSPAWDGAPPEAKRAYIYLYGRNEPPKSIDTWAERYAVRMAMTVSHADEAPEGVDVEREAIQLEGAA